jgi:hypothetical protein
MKAILDYRNFPPEQRGQDAKGWKFTTHEHDEMAFPVVIQATDPSGKSCNYIAVGPDGAAIKIKAVKADQQQRPKRWQSS